MPAEELHRNALIITLLLLHLLALSQHLQLLRPHDVAQELSRQIEHRSGRHNDDKEDESQGKGQHIQHGIDPNARHMFDDVQPDEVAGHEEGQTSDARLATRVLAEGREQFQQDKDDNVRVQDMVQPTGREVNLDK